MPALAPFVVDGDVRVRKLRLQHTQHALGRSLRNAKTLDEVVEGDPCVARRNEGCEREKLLGFPRGILDGSRARLHDLLVRYFALALRAGGIVLLRKRARRLFPRDARHR